MSRQKLSPIYGRFATRFIFFFLKVLCCRSLGASHGTIELEMKRLQELETMVYKDFRRFTCKYNV